MQNKHIKNFFSESCSNLLVAEAYSLCVPATPCSTTSTPRLISVEGRKIYNGQQGQCRDDSALSSISQAGTKAQICW